MGIQFLISPDSQTNCVSVLVGSLKKKKQNQRITGLMHERTGKEPVQNRKYHSWFLKIKINFFWRTVAIYHNPLFGSI
jgi:hypothetical protein